MRTCTKCKSIKDEDEFDKKGNGLSSHCKTCRKEYVNSHYQRNKEYYKKKAKKSDRKYVNDFIDYKKSLSCTDCGVSFKDKYWICDFHHINRLEKEYNISKIVKTTKRKLTAELKKCIPLCANCHRTRHYNEFIEV